MCRLKTTRYTATSVHIQSVDHWIILIIPRAEVTRRYRLYLLLDETAVDVLLSNSGKTKHSV